MIIVAHRGWWERTDEKNSPRAFERALRAGFGIETDIRDCMGQVVISHDPPASSGLLRLVDFADLYQTTGSSAPLALNIKSDGLQGCVLNCLTTRGITNYFVFDMAVPDALGYVNRGAPTYTRQSKYEPMPSFYDRASGVWIDCFDGELCSNDVIAGHFRAGKNIALVSPELHNKPHEVAWRQWKPFAMSRIMICTDFPDRADEYFNG